MIYLIQNFKLVTKSSQFWNEWLIWYIWTKRVIDFDIHPDVKVPEEATIIDDTSASAETAEFANVKCGDVKARDAVSWW